MFSRAAAFTNWIIYRLIYLPVLVMYLFALLVVSGMAGIFAAFMVATLMNLFRVPDYPLFMLFGRMVGVPQAWGAALGVFTLWRAVDALLLAEE